MRQPRKGRRVSRYGREKRRVSQSPVYYFLLIMALGFLAFFVITQCARL